MFYAELIKSIPNYHQILPLISVPSNAQAGSHNNVKILQRSLFGEDPGRVAQSLGHLTRKSEVLGSIPGLAVFFRFSFR